MGKDQGMSGLTAEVLEAVAVTQAVGLGVLRAEMDALARLLPGQAEGETEAEAAARLAAEAAEIEAGFDNMPV
ncbi:MAG: hypothetical protein RLZZ563_2439 [Pseudomonadota bacterium]|jgi:hypothetical protein